MNKSNILKLNIVIDLEVMQKLHLTLNEFSVAYLIKELMTNPESEIPGWAAYSKKDYATILNLSESTVFRILKKLNEKGLIVRYEKTQFLRVTNAWYNETNNIQFDTPHVNLTPPMSKGVLLFPPHTPPNTSPQKKHSVSKETSQGNPDVERILKEFSEISGYPKPTDAKPRQWAYLFAKNKGVENFRPCAEYLIRDKGMGITKLGTIYRNYEIFTTDTGKSIHPHRILTAEEMAMMEGRT